MQERIGLSCPVELRAAGHDKPYPLIEPHGLFVLLIDVKLGRVQGLNGVLKQPAADTHPAPCQVNEQHINFDAIDAKETDDLGVRIPGTNQVIDLRQTASNEGPEKRNICLNDEVMSCPHRRFPDLDDARVILRCGRSALPIR